MISRINFEKQIGALMSQLCSSPDERASSVSAETPALFEINTRYDDVVRVLGPPILSIQHDESGVPESLRGSIEHRFRLELWQDFDFVVCESRFGYAWGHRFARSSNSPTPPIGDAADLHRWSHTLEEVAKTLGPAKAAEEWFPWYSATFELSAGRFQLCFVLELLQSIVRV